MYDLGAYPAVVKGTNKIQGEVFEIDDSTLERLDELEGHPEYYVRVKDTTADGQLVWIYTMNHGQVLDKDQILGGDWVQHRQV
eukprot:gene13853-16369_t